MTNCTMEICWSHAKVNIENRRVPAIGQDDQYLNKQAVAPLSPPAPLLSTGLCYTELLAGLLA